MSVASINPFSLLSEDTEVPEVAKVEKKETKADKTQAPQQATRGTQKPRGGAGSKGGRYYARGGGAKPQTREGGAEAEESAPAREERRNGDAGRGRGRGGGRGRGDRGGGRGAPGARGRTFDKHSQTGRTDTQKQVNQGWGSDEGKSELKAEEEGSKDAATETPVAASGDWAEGAGGDDAWGTPAPASGDAPAQEGAATPGERRRQEEEEDNTLTLEEYLKQQKEKLSTVVPKLGEDNVRKANEGEDVFEGAVLHAKDEEDAYFAGKTRNAPKQRSKAEKAKETIAYEGHFADASRGFRGRGRGGDRNGESREYRGRGRGGRGGRGAPREGGRGRAEANGNGNVDVADESAFPVLGA
ncbi:hypothetical protein SCHPADRAFT_934888 [Schizopora paradoxa]|uniref:Hyaluronan/mRNA-binding protein domain-containing protein n=1 Tax=Schizopora paradoxa TaxID=27342 RepID=A0A0H2S7R3_9AGAM|nr:hypothetical protein SCHPADRAFT_934888 [Schizopora paradoxa]